MISMKKISKPPPELKYHAHPTTDQINGSSAQIGTLPDRIIKDCPPAKMTRKPGSVRQLWLVTFRR